MPNCSSNAVGQPLRQFLRAGHHHAQAAEILRRAAAHVELQERRRRQQERQRVLADQRADGFGIQRVGMIDHPHAQHRRQAQRAGEAEGMEERQDAQQSRRAGASRRPVRAARCSSRCCSAEHHALGIARAAAGEDDRGQVVQRRLASPRPSDRSSQRSRQQPGASSSAQSFSPAPRLGRRPPRASTVSPGSFELHLVEERPRGDHGLDAALADAGGERFLGTV